MNSSKISLPDFLIAELFKDNIVLIDNELNLKQNIQSTPASGEPEEMILVSREMKQKTTPQNEQSFAFLGSNKKNISIVVNDGSAIHLQDDLLEILSAILTACKLNLADVSIVNTDTQVVTDNILRKALSPKITLLFGVETTAIELPFSIPVYKPQSFNNCTYLQCAAIEKLKGNSNEAKLEKSKLWVCLKNLFGI